MAVRTSTAKTFLPKRYKGTLSKSDLLFECKENYKGNFVYRKLIPDPNHCVTHDDNIGLAVKSTGKWWHEDDFAVKWTSPQKQRVFVVKHDDGVVYRIDAIYVPGEGWKESGELSDYIENIDKKTA